METIKFIVEIDEQYIRDHANFEKVTELIENEVSKSDFMRGLADVFGFKSLEEKIDDGATEFTINRDNVNPKANGIFEHIVGNLAVLAGVMEKDDKDEQ